MFQFPLEFIHSIGCKYFYILLLTTGSLNFYFWRIFLLSINIVVDILSGLYKCDSKKEKEKMWLRCHMTSIGFDARCFCIVDALYVIHHFSLLPFKMFCFWCLSLFTMKWGCLFSFYLSCLEFSENLKCVSRCLLPPLGNLGSSFLSYKLNSIPSKFVCWSSHPQWNCIWRQGL